MSKMRDFKGRKSVIILIPLLFVLLGSSLAFGALGEEPKGKIPEKVFRIQMPFIANEGQIGDEHVRFYATTFAGTVYVTDKGEMVYLLSSSSDPKAGKRHLSTGTTKTWMIKEKLVGSSKTLPEGKDKPETKVDYFIGNDKSKWKTDVATYNSVSLGEVYPGVELELKAYGKRVEKVFTVKPGTNPRAINVRIEGAKSPKINEQGELQIKTGLGEVRYSKPLAYQEKNGKRESVQVAYYLHKNTYGFRVSDYDATLPLVIDPELVYSTFLGGTGEDKGYGIAVDGSGNFYVTGATASASPSAGFLDVFVSKFDANNYHLYTKYFGGKGDDAGYGVAVDSVGNIYVTGFTNSTNFSIRNSVKYGGKGDAFVTKLDSSGGIGYSRYLGGSSEDAGWGIALDSAGNVYVTGYTKAQNFPTVNPYTKNNAGAVDVFVTKLKPDGNLCFSTYIGGSDEDYGDGIAVDSGGNICVTGYTHSTRNFPISSYAYQKTNAGDWDAFVTTFKNDSCQANGSCDANSCFYSLSYSSYFGGSGFDQGHGIALDNSGKIYVTGETNSTGFPLLDAYQSNFNGGDSDAFIAKFDPEALSSNTSLVYSTFLGGSGRDKGYAIAVDNSGNIYEIGETNSPGLGTEAFPVTPDAYQNNFVGGLSDAFVTILNPSAANPVYSTYLGGEGEEQGFGIAVNTRTSESSECGNAWNVHLTGYTTSTEFPTVNPYMGMYAGNHDAFVAKFSNDTDGDGVPDLCDGCPNDPYKTEPGACGCGNPDIDSDGDGIMDCVGVDNCPAVFNPDQVDTDGDGYGEACDLCPQKAYAENNGGPCREETGTLTASTLGPKITVTLTYNGSPTYLVRPDCDGNTVFTSDPPIRTNCRRRPPYVLTVLEGDERPGYGSPGGDWVPAVNGDSWTINCNLLEIFDESSLMAAGTLQITAMYTLLSGDRDLDPVTEECAEGKICVDTAQYPLFRGAIEAQVTSVQPQGWVKIDIKPGAAPNSINLGSEGSVPVAILSTPSFDATTVDLSTVLFEGQGVVPKGKGYQASNVDINGDGLKDKVVHFYTQSLQITDGYEPACVTGTNNEVNFAGCDSVKIVP